MTTGLQAIETFYNGYRFRSRLEARWAVFFQTLGVKYQYEVQGFELGIIGRYLPDFWLTDLKHWVEVKPKTDDVVLDPKCQALAEQGENPVIRLAGDPFLGEYYASYYNDSDGWNSDSARLVFALDRCDIRATSLWLLGDQENIAIPVNPSYACWSHMTEDHEMLRAAYFTARQARFEFGENGKRLPAVRPATPLSATSLSRVTVVRLVRLEPYDGQFGPAIRWVVVDTQAGSATPELSWITSTKLAPRSKSRRWAEIFLRCPIGSYENGRAVTQALLGTEAVARIEVDDRGWQTVAALSENL